MKFFHNLFCRCKTQMPTGTTLQEAPHNYGISENVLANIREEHKQNPLGPDVRKIILTNPKDCENKINAVGLTSFWRGTGHVEWEYHLAAQFISAVLEALEAGKNEADITGVFAYDLYSDHNRVFTKEQVYAHLIRWFDIESESDEELRLRIKIGSTSKP